MESILTTIKNLLGIEASYTHFDSDITVYINSVFTNLTQLGVGPITGFSIADATETWSDFLGEDVPPGSIPAYIYLKVRLLFDPPSSAFVLEATERLISEMEWRINVLAEGGTTDG